MRRTIFVIAAVCATPSPCLAQGRHLICPAQVSQTIGDTTTIWQDGLRLYLDETRHSIVFEGSLLRPGRLSFKTRLFSPALITAEVTDRTAGSYFDAPAKPGFLRLDRKKQRLVVGMYLLPKGVVIETAICERAGKPNA